MYAQTLRHFTEGAKITISRTTQTSAIEIASRLRMPKVRSSKILNSSIKQHSTCMTIIVGGHRSNFD